MTTCSRSSICAARAASRSPSAGPTRPRSRTSTPRRISRCSAKPRTSSTISSRPGRRGAREGVFEAKKFEIDVTQDADPALRSAEVRSLSLCRRAVLARLPVHLRVLRHHRALRPGAAHQDHAADAGRTRCALRARLSRPCRFRRRQSDRQQEGGEGVPAAISRHGSKRTTIRSSSRPRPRSISPTTTNCCG